MKECLMAIVMTVACVGLTGCIESNDAYVLNPDGSGKVKRIVIFQPKGELEAGLVLGDGMQPKKKTPAEEVKDAGKAEIEESEGVEVWKEAKSYRTQDGRICFVGTAYFKDISELKFHNGGFSMDQKAVWTNDAQGRRVLEFVESGKNEGEDGSVVFRPAKKVTGKTMTAAEVKEAVVRAREQHEETKQIMGKGLSSLKMYMSFRLPGKVVEVRNFKYDKEGNPCVLFSGAKMLEAMDKRVKDDKWMETQVRAGVSFDLGGGSELSTEETNEAMFGSKGSVRATVATAGMSPLFDYTAEVAAAKAAYPAVLKQLGAAGSGGMAVRKLAPIAGQALRNVKVMNVSLLADANHAPTIRVAAELPSAGVEANEGMTEKVVADNGTDLLPGEDFHRKIPFPWLQSDQTNVEFDIEIRQPPAGVKRIAEMSGHLVYSVSSGTKVVDLGITELATGAVGTEYRATIAKVEASTFEEGAHNIALDLAVPYGAVKSVQVFDSAGKSLEAEKSGGGGFFGKSSVTIKVKGMKSPMVGRIKLELHDNIKLVKAPFTLTNVVLSAKGQGAGDLTRNGVGAMPADMEKQMKAMVESFAKAMEAGMKEGMAGASNAVAGTKAAGPAPDSYADLRKTYDDELTKIKQKTQAGSRERADQTARLTGQYDKALEARVAKLTGEGKTEEAEAVREERQRANASGDTKRQDEPQRLTSLQPANDNGNGEPGSSAPTKASNTRKVHVNDMRGFAGNPKEENNIYKFSIEKAGHRATLVIWGSGDIGTDTYGKVTLAQRNGQDQVVYNWTPKDFSITANSVASYEKLAPIVCDVSKFVKQPGEYRVTFKWTGGGVGLSILRVELVVE